MCRCQDDNLLGKSTYWNEKNTYNYTLLQLN